MPQENLINNPEDIKINEDQDIQQILGRPPGWILHWGITLVFFAVAMLLLVSWIVKFPDIIPAQVVLTTENPPVRVFTRSEGKLSELLVANETAVKKGELLAIMENTGEWKDIVQLEGYLDQIYQLPITEIVAVEIPRHLNIGRLQHSFSILSSSFDEYAYFLGEGTVKKKIKSIKQRIFHLRKLNTSLENQKGTLNKVIGLARENHERFKKLQIEGAASKVEVDEAETLVLERERELESLGNQIINNNIEKESLKMTILDFEQGKDDKNVGQSLDIKKQIEQLRSELKKWKQDFLIYAPIDGKVNLVKIWSAQQYLKAEEELLAIIPESSAGKIIGKATLAAAGAGKVELDMPANIRLDGFPYQEFGSIEGTVKNISMLPENGQYNLEIEVPINLRTTYEKIIPFRQEMTGVANIITEDKRIIERIFDRVWSLIKNR